MRLFKRKVLVVDEDERVELLRLVRKRLDAMPPPPPYDISSTVVHHRRLHRLKDKLER